MIKFEQQLEEAFSSISFMDVSELRTLYYGRLNVYASFGDNGVHETSGYEGSLLLRPYGVVAHSIESIVARKVSSSYFYANIFRFKKSGRVLDTTNYTAEQYKKDTEELMTISSVDETVLSRAMVLIDKNLTLRSYFDRIWELTRLLADEKKHDKDRYWTKLFLEMGYTAILDQRGKGIIIPQKTPVLLVLDDYDIIDLDIAPIQKYRKDRRQNVIRRINIKNKKLWAKRNRIAKRRTDKYRTDTKKSGLAASVEEFRDLLMSGGL